MIKTTFNQIRAARDYFQLPSVAKAERRKDKKGLPAVDPGIDLAVKEGIGWICRAQDSSMLNDGGVARYFSLLSGWSSSYPETTGYIIPTMFEYSKKTGDTAVFSKAVKMLDWLVSIQLPSGGFQGGLIDSEPVVPVAFNTGSVLLGLVSGARELGEKYRTAMCNTADWLVKAQDADGCWRKYPSPFAEPGEKAYDAHIAWGFFEADRIEPGRGYAASGLASVKWALKFQRENGWFEQCDTLDSSHPTTHSLGCVLRGVLEAYYFTKDPELLHLSQKTADGLLRALRLKDGFLPGRLDADWQGVVPWACCTGTVQIAHCWLLLYQITGEKKFLDAGLAANRFVRRTMKIDGQEEMRGAVKGSFPVNGGYGAYRFINPKFCIDSCLLEQEIINQRQ